MLLDIGGNWSTFSYMSIPNMLNGQLEYAGHERTETLSFQELCTDPCDMGRCFIMLKHEVMAADEWRDGGPQDLDTISLCAQAAID
jgi:hypothetical protein